MEIHMQPLFVEPTLTFQKEATETKLPEDPNTWPHEILQELYKAVPYVADFDPSVVMDRVDAERMYGFGHIEIGNKTEVQGPPDSKMMQAAGVRHVRLPIIITEGKLQPFDTIVTEDSKMLPLTERRLRTALFRPETFDVTSRSPGDQSMIATLYPPYRQNYGFGGGGAVMSAGMGKEGMAKEAIFGFSNEEKATEAAIKQHNHYTDYMNGIIKKHGKEDPTLPGVRGLSQEEYDKHSAEYDKKYGTNVTKAAGAKTASWGMIGSILHTINESDFNRFISEVSDPEVKLAFFHNKAGTGPVIETLKEYVPPTPGDREKRAFAQLKPTVAHVKHTSEGYVVKTASHLAWEPVSRVLDRGQLVEMLGAPAVLTLDKVGSATLTDDAPIKADESEEAQPDIVKEYGIYKVQDDKGRDLIGVVYPNLIDVDGHLMPMALFTNGSQAAVQGEVAGVRVGDGVAAMYGRPRGHGFFCRTLPDGRVEAMVPLTVHASLGGQAREGASLMAETMDGRQVEVMLQPGLAQVTMSDESHVLVPSDYQWCSLEEADDVSLVSQVDGFSKAAGYHNNVVYIRGDHSGVFSVSGSAVEKLAEDQREFIDIENTLFLLAGLGVEPSYASTKMGQAVYHSTPVRVKIAREIQTKEHRKQESFPKTAAAVELIRGLRRNLTKEAAVLPDPMSVDAVLSLGFINPENLVSFIGYLPVLNTAQEHLCELLIAARMGVRELPIYALERTVRNLEEVIEGLSVIAFQKN